MHEEPDDLARIDESGTTRPVGATAALRMQARAGAYHVLPAPPHMLLLRRADDAGVEAGDPSRVCLLAGEIGRAGSLCDIVSFIAHSAWTGELLVFDEGSSRSLYFEQGFVVGAQSTAASDRLGEVLWRYGILDRDQIFACSEATGSGAARFGEAAVKLGFVTREKLWSLMGRQTEEVFYRTILVEQGTFYFLESFDETLLSSRQRLSVTTLVREGIRRMHETRYFRARIPTDAHVPVKIAGGGTLDEPSKALLVAIDGTRSVADLGRQLGQGEFEISRAIFQLVQSGHVAIHPPRPSLADVVSICNQAVALVLRELDALDEGDQVRAQLAAFAQKEKTYVTLFAGAGPEDDGTLDPKRVAQNAKALPAATRKDETLSKLFHEYASYALFLARPHLRRAQAKEHALASDASSKTRLSQRVATMLEPLAIHGAEATKQPNRGTS